MASDTPAMVIVGAGECGARAAVALRQEGYDGPVVLVGAERHHPYERPPLSKGTAADWLEPLPKLIGSAEDFAERGITVLSPVEAVGIDRAARLLELADGRRIPYAKLLLATGAVPRSLPGAEASPRCLALRTFDDALAIRIHLRPGRHLAVIGGGFIGLELAAAAREAGAAVTVIEAQTRILARGVPSEIAAVIHARHEAAGVTFRLGEGLAGLTQRADGVDVRFAAGDTLAADLVVVGIGAIPNVALAQRAGLAVDNGIAVDECLHTADPDILAAGDCCSFPLAIYGGRRVRLEAWRNAQEQGTLAARNMLGRGDAHVAIPWFWSDQYDLGLQVAGLADEGAETVRRDLGDGAFLLFHLTADGRLVAASGIGPGASIGREVRLAEMLIAARAAPSREALASPDQKLKGLLAAARPHAARGADGERERGSIR